MELYKKAIFALAEERKDQLFYNSSELHAEIVHQAIAKTAERYICILSGSLCTEISNNERYCELMNEFLSKDASRKVQIILTDYQESFLLKSLNIVFQKYRKQVDVRRFNGSVRRNNLPVHFTFADDRMFRLETDIEKHMAFGNFNSPEQVMSLKNVFNDVFQRSDIINY